MEQIQGETPATGRDTTGQTGRESLPPVAKSVRTAIAEATPEAIQPCDERGMNAAEAEKAYNRLYEQAYPCATNWGDMGGDGEEASLITNPPETQIAEAEVDLTYYKPPENLGPLTTDSKGNLVIPPDWYATLISM